MSKPIKIHSSFDFVTNFLPTISNDLLDQQLPFNIYRLETLLPHLKAPVPLHRTTFNYLVFQTSGTALNQVDTETIEMHANDVLLIRQGHIIATQAIDTMATGFFILFENETLPFLFKGNEIQRILETNPLISLSPEDGRWVEEVCQLLVTQIQQPAKATPEICLHLFAALLHKVTLHSTLANSRPDRGSEVAAKFKQLVFAKAVQEKTIQYYASQLHISDNYLNRCVKGATGKAPKDWIIEICLLQSKVLLQHTNADIAEVAFQVGFTDPSYFSRLFKKKFGQSPTVYQAAYWQELSEQRQDLSYTVR
jgi:AraC-like DNA-binding protein